MVLVGPSHLSAFCDSVFRGTDRGDWSSAGRGVHGYTSHSSSAKAGSASPPVCTGTGVPVTSLAEETACFVMLLPLGSRGRVPTDGATCYFYCFLGFAFCV